MSAWRWLTSRVTMRPRRITAAFWLLIFMFQNGISRVLQRYSHPLGTEITWAIAVLCAVLVLIFAHAWYRGRDARRRQREG